jgi:hypothetical protein
MSDIKLQDNANDILLVNGNLSLADGQDAIMQQVRIRLRFFYGEWFLNRNEGVPYYADILVKSPDTGLITGILSRVVRETPGIKSVESFGITFNRATRTLACTFAATCDTGTTLRFDEFVLGNALPANNVSGSA